jgi:hypothetical protein
VRRSNGSAQANGLGLFSPLQKSLAPVIMSGG